MVPPDDVSFDTGMTFYSVNIYGIRGGLCNTTATTCTVEAWRERGGSRECGGSVAGVWRECGGSVAGVWRECGGEYFRWM
jgi:hypothetical protein